MLHVPVTVRPSPVHGLGAFAAAPIARGALVWDFTPDFDLEVAPSALDTVPPLLRERLRHYGYVDKHLNKYVLCCDDARFLNHSANPNLVHDATGGGHGCDRAARDIAVGEELTLDYGAFENTLLPEQAAAAVQAARTGIILNTENFAACRTFYRDVLGLPELFGKHDDGDELCCLAFGGAYLMIETSGYANPAGKSVRECPAKLRFNVPDLEATARRLHAHGIAAEIQRFAWGATINLFDPDGNRVGIRDEAGFIAQMNP